jgi:hypothetical protein
MSNVIANLRVIGSDDQPINVANVDGGKIITVTHVWNPDTLAYEAMTQPTFNTDKLTITSSNEDIREILVELRAMSTLLNEGLNTREDLDNLRDEIKTDL